MKAVVLAGGMATATFFLANHYPKLILPLANTPMLAYMLASLKRTGITEVAVIIPGSSDLDCSLKKRLGAIAEGMSLSFFKEDEPRGTAGSLKELEGFIGSAHFFVIGSSVYLYGVDLQEFISYHKAAGSVATVIVEKASRHRAGIENVEIDEKGRVKKVQVLHHSVEKRRHLLTSGIYIFSPEVLRHIYDTGYMDIKEQLIPALKEGGFDVRAYEAAMGIKRLDTLTDYFDLNKEVLFGFDALREPLGLEADSVSERIWTGRNVKISSGAFVIGPVVIGDGSVIEDGAKVIGPASIGRGTRIGRGALVRESIIWDNVRLLEDSTVEYSLVLDEGVVSNGERIADTIVVNEDAAGHIDAVLQDKECEIETALKVVGRGRFLKALRRGGYRFAKRCMDLGLSAAGLVLMLPVIVIIAAAIKLDSRGPVIFSQKRCGLDGVEFTMYKFRTMNQGAEKMQTELAGRKDIDGPMFKMNNDPRVTRVGAFLRRSSLDEIPQLFNVLKGDMSLVGPRPLAMSEMKFASSWRDIRLRVKPGVTGLWQINGRSDVSFHDWIKHDITYVMKHSIMSDIRILVRTIKIAIRGIGAR